MSDASKVKKTQMTKKNCWVPTSQSYPGERDLQYSISVPQLCELQVTGGQHKSRGFPKEVVNATYLGEVALGGCNSVTLRFPWNFSDEDWKTNNIGQGRVSLKVAKPPKKHKSIFVYTNTIIRTW